MNTLVALNIGFGVLNLGVGIMESSLLNVGIAALCFAVAYIIKEKR